MICRDAEGAAIRTAGRRRAWIGPRAALIGFAMAAGCVAGTGDGGEPPPDGGTEVVDYDVVFDQTQVLDLELEIDAADWSTMLADPLSDEYREATLIFGDERYEGVGVRFKGNSSRRFVADSGSDRFSFKIDINRFAPDQTFHGAKKLNLNNGFKDPSLIREKLANDLLRAAGVPAPRTSFVRLYLNGEYYGLYSNVEQVDKRFLMDRFGNDTGNLYKPEIPVGSLVYLGDTLADYGPDAGERLGLRTNEDAADFSGLFYFMEVLDGLPSSPDPMADISAVLEVEGFLTWLAVSTVLVNLDSYAGMGHNYYLYDNPDTGKMEFISWDVNEAFGNFRCGLPPGPDIHAAVIDFDVHGPICGPPPERPLVTNLLAIPELQQRYEIILSEIVSSELTSAAFDGDVGTWTDLIDASVATDPRLLYGYDAFLRAPDEDVMLPGHGLVIGLRPFVSERIPAVIAQLP